MSILNIKDLYMYLYKLTFLFRISSPSTDDHSVKLNVLVEKSLQISRLLEPVGTVQLGWKVPLPHSGLAPVKHRFRLTDLISSSLLTTIDYTGSLPELYRFNQTAKGIKILFKIYSRFLLSKT